MSIPIGAKEANVCRSGASFVMGWWIGGEDSRRYQKSQLKNDFELRYVSAWNASRINIGSGISSTRSTEFRELQ